MSVVIDRHKSRYVTKIARGAIVSLFLAVHYGCASPRPKSEIAFFPLPPIPPRVVHLKSFNSIDDLVPARATFADMIRGNPPRPFAETPAGIAYHDGHLYICDLTLRVVHDWNLTTGEARRFSTAASKPLGSPIAVAVDSNGRIYVGDTGRGEILTFSATGQSGPAFRLPENEAFRPVAIAVQNEELYAADTAGARILVFATSDGHVLRTIGGASDPSPQHFLPMGVARSGDGTSFVTDMVGGRVLVFGADGTFVRAFGQRGDRFGDFGEPRQISVASDNVLFIADAEFARIHIFDAEGTLLMLLGNPTGKPGATPHPIGVATASTLPDSMTRLVPGDFEAKYFLFVSNSVGDRRLSLFAIGGQREK